MNFKFFKPLSIALLAVGMGQFALAMENQANDKLLKAVRSDYSILIREALNNGANINCTDEDRWTPLHLASFFNCKEAAKLLLDCGADINCTNNYGETPLHIVSRADLLEMAKLLLNYYANINCAENNGDTPLHIASIWNNPEIIKLLLDHCANINCADNNGDTPLHIASHPEIIKLLLDHCADINLTNKNGYSALDIARICGTDTKINLIVEEAERRKKAKQEEFNALCNKRIFEHNNKHLNRSITIKGQEFKLHEALLSARCPSLCLELNPDYKNEAHPQALPQIAILEELPVAQRAVIASVLIPTPPIRTEITKIQPQKVPAPALVPGPQRAKLIPAAPRTNGKISKSNNK